MPSKSDWEKQLKRIYEDKASVEKVAEELNVSKKVVRQRYERYLKKLLENHEKKLEKIEKEADEKERRVKSLSENIKKAEEKLEETEEKLPEMNKLEKIGEEWEEKIEKSSKLWKNTKKTLTIVIIIAIILAVISGSIYLIYRETPEIKTSNLNIPEEGFVGENLPITFNITNMGEESFDHTYNLKFNGETVKQETVHLAPGDNQRQEIYPKVTDHGFISVELNGIKENFTSYRTIPFSGAQANYSISSIDFEIEELIQKLEEEEDLTVGDLLGIIEVYHDIHGEYEIISENETHYVQNFEPGDPIEDVLEPKEFTSKRTTPLTLTDQEWEELEFQEYIEEETKFGKLTLGKYSITQEIGEGLTYEFSLKLEENTNLPYLYEEGINIFGNYIPLLEKELDYTTLEYFEEE